MTPPRSRLGSPTPRVQHILTVVQQLESGTHTRNGDWLEFHLEVNEFHDLDQRRSENSFWQDKLHWDYFPSLQLFAIRMPGRLHERVLALTRTEIERQLSSLAKGPASDFAKDITFDGSVDYYPADPGDDPENPACGPHVPDGTFQHLKEPYPGVVVEVSYSQARKRLPVLANDYILGSDMRIRVMVGFDVSYQKKETALIVWRPQLQTANNQQWWTVESKIEVLRDEHGHLNRDTTTGLTLNLHDFASVEFCEKFDCMDGTIFISCNTLCQILLDAERNVDLKPAVPAKIPGLNKRWVLRSLKEKPAMDDECRFLEAEGRAEERADREDSSIKES